MMPASPCTDREAIEKRNREENVRATFILHTGLIRFTGDYVWQNGYRSYSSTVKECPLYISWSCELLGSCLRVHRALPYTPTHNRKIF